jgi:hypothetical protein
VDLQRAGRLFGWAFIGTFVTSIPSRLLFINGLGASWTNVRFVPVSASATNLRIGAVLEFALIIFNIATAVVLYPIVRRQSPRVSLGYVTARVMECTFIAIGLMSIISVTNVIDSLSGASGVRATALVVQGNSLAHTYEWAFLFGPGLVVGFGNGLMLGYLMYRSGLVPRPMTWFGLIGGPLLILSFVLQLSKVYGNGSGPSALLALPETIWEAFLGIYCAWKGFRSVAIADEPPELAMAR